MKNSINKLIRRRSSDTNRGVYCQLCILLITTLFALKGSAVLGFVLCNNVVVNKKIINDITKMTELFAAKKGGSSSSSTKSNSRQVNAKGGFGRIAGPKNDFATIDDDYRVFPALESRVRDTLIPATTTFTGDDEMEFDMNNNIDVPLSSEIYQRLDQIYGFPFFNFHDNSVISSLSDDSQNIVMLPVQSSPLDFLLNTDSSDIESISNTDSSQALEVSELSLSLQELPPFSNVQVLHVDPMILSIDNFFTSEECEQYIQQSETKSLGNNGGEGIGSTVMQSRSPTVGKDAAAKAQRTSTTFYHKYETVPELMSKASRLLGIPTIHQWEEPQTVRYRKNEKFTWHLDALGPSEQSSSSGQRTATLLVYLTDLDRNDGGATLFRDLGNATSAGDCKYLRVQPKKGMALLFFPSAGGIVDCPFDIRTLHCGEVISNDATCDKWIAQLWLRQRSYTPTAPPGNRHSDAYPAIANYCQQYTKKNKT